MHPSSINVAVPIPPIESPNIKPAFTNRKTHNVSFSSGVSLHHHLGLGLRCHAMSCPQTPATDVTAAKSAATRSNLNAGPANALMSLVNMLISPGDGEVAEEVIQMSLIAGGGHHFVGSTSGLLLANLLQSRPQPSSSLTTSWKPNSLPGLTSPQTNSGLPPKTLASELLKVYCSHDHLRYPFLSTKSLYRSLDAVYEDSSAKDPVDAFFIDMTLAIGTAQVHKFNWNGVYDAETHYNRAMTRLADVLARNGIERLQALLLMGLHRAATYALPRTLDEPTRKVKEEEMETKRRCFWSLVALDRVTSLALGRPLALQLEDIDVDLPPSSTADQLPEDSSPLSSAPYGTPQYRAATSVFVHIVRYRLICGKIIKALHRSAKHVTFPNTSYEEMRTALARELQEWHTETANLPLVKNDTAASPASGSSFRSEEWYRLLYHNQYLRLCEGGYKSLCKSPPIAKVELLLDNDAFCLLSRTILHLRPTPSLLWFRTSAREVTYNTHDQPSRQRHEGLFKSVGSCFGEMGPGEELFGFV
ncbi:transcription activator acu-15 [Fusarium agapanthi]|uniref:Transcription activator acu-15 n=1 Tax=Fusarium agapanthi TaxID=1803897 RepID=A0A9P5BFA7_9HYPO|nr:transcription activator acu-15 [Fusarium agapanthi]